MTIERGNKLIGDFMGKDFKDPLNLMYDKSWDWLRPVIDKIFEYSLAYPDEAAKVCNMKIVVNIDAAWEKVIQFIEWHNEQKDI